MILLFCLVVLSLALLAAAWTDLSSYTIPNRIGLAVAVVGLVAALDMGGWEGGLRQTGIALALLVAGAALFFFRVWGAGDAKLLAALGFWAPPEGLMVMITWTAMSGGLLALLLILARRIFKRNRWNLAVLEPKQGVPYALAIDIGAAMMILSGHSVIANTSLLG